MPWRQWTQLLLFREAESDEGFRQELLRESHSGLKVIGVMTIGAALFLMTGWFLIFGDQESSRLRYVTHSTVAVIGLIELAIARLPWSYLHARRIAILMVQLTTAVLIGFSLILVEVDPTLERFVPTELTLAVLALVIALPLSPWMVLLHTLAIGIIYVSLVKLAAASFASDAEVQGEYLLFLAMMGFLATFLAVVLHRQRWTAYSSYLETLRAAGELRRAEARLAISESASSTTRLAAAISHEINNPIGALASSVDTLLLLGAKQSSAAPEQMPRLVKLQADLRRVIQQSLDRLQQTVARLARFTNLDQADRQYTRVNDLLIDVADLVRARLKPGEELVLQLQPIPEIPANPQRLSAVFYDVMSNSATALNGGGRIEVETKELSAAIQVVIRDNGSGIPREKLKDIFDPALQQSTDRVAAGNWSMFNARQIVRESGGQIAISSEQGVGTLVTITLPCGVLT